MQSPQSSHKKIQIEWVENTEVGFERGEYVTIRTLCYILSFLLQEIRLEPVEEEVLESKSVGFKSFFFFLFFCLAAVGHSVSLCCNVVGTTQGLS